MNRPFVLRIAPVGLKTKFFYRFYSKRRKQFESLYKAARLHYAPGVTMQLMPTDEGHSNIAFTGFYELDLTERIVNHAKQGGVLVDVGANYGYFSLLWSAVRPDNKVIV